MEAGQPTVEMEKPLLQGDAAPGLIAGSDAPAEKTYRAGTLVYTKMGLIALFFWLLWGDFCYTLMETALPKLLPLKLKSLGTSNLVVGLLAGSIPSMMSMVVTPVVGYRSDRYRGRWGRRLPFLFWPTPFVALFLILLGCSEGIGAMLHRVVFARMGTVSSTAVVLATVSLLIVSFQFFNLIVVSVYYYLFKDVVPEALVGRFMAMFKVIGAAAIIVFQMFIFGHADKYMREIFVGAAILYLVGFTLMCWKVREGEYPPPQETEGPGFVCALKTYFRECFSHRFYICFFAGTALYSMSCACNMFSVFFCQSLNMSLDQIGKVNAWLNIPTMILLYPMGILADRINPLRLLVPMTLLLVPLNLACFFFIHDSWSYVVVTLIGIPIVTAYGASYLPMFMTLLPKDRYGQFCSAQLLINAAVMILSNFLAGAFMDFMKDLLRSGDAYYRYIYIWSAFFQVLSFIFMVAVYRKWKKYGGKYHYVPPLPTMGPVKLVSDR